jgi:hypothetical protein
MIDPKRWLDEGGGATSEERELLQAGRDVRMSDRFRNRVWGGVAAGLTTIETVAAAGTALQKGAAVKGAFTVLSSTAAKSVTALAIAGGVSFGVASLRSPSEPPAETRVARAVPSVQPALPAVAEFLAPREADNAPLPETSAIPSLEAAKPRALHARRPGRAIAEPPDVRASDSDVQAAPPSQESRRASRLAEESAAVVAIRKTLLSGQPSEALRMLDRARVQFADGVLGQEREALTVRALVESGQKVAARKRGEAFLRAFPRSPHADELRALLGP